MEAPENYMRLLAKSLVDDEAISDYLGMWHDDAETTLNALDYLG